MCSESYHIENEFCINDVFFKFAAGKERALAQGHRQPSILFILLKVKILLLSTELFEQFAVKAEDLYFILHTSTSVFLVTTAVLLWSVVDVHSL